MVTDEMIERLAFYADHEDLSLELSGSPKACDDELQPLLKELLAALSTDAEPVGWHIPGSTAITKDKDVTDRWRFGNTSTVIDPVFAAPPAPSVAVKSAWAAKAAVLRSRGKKNTLHDINQAADYLDAASLSPQVPAE